MTSNNKERKEQLQKFAEEISQALPQKEYLKEEESQKEFDPRMLYPEFRHRMMQKRRMDKVLNRPK